ncbi:hypothetical protein Glove_88g29 [Diversispora epigaea]|uniref:Uncharacterized protein n=1 Tax=Diversispora epigaea TaxID=1348612 RepID=A0A397J874_9GLOM|nr:hypothetical protein Glove_88g29 [Diversispora epigaea]
MKIILAIHKFEWIFVLKMIRYKKFKIFRRFNRRKTNNLNYIPFNTGPHSGNKLALLETKVFFYLIRNFKFREIEGFTFKKIHTSNDQKSAKFLVQIGLAYLCIIHQFPCLFVPVIHYLITGTQPNLEL